MARKLIWETAAWSASTAVGDRILSVPFGGSRAFTELVSATAVESAPRDFVWVERVRGSLAFCTYADAAPPPFGQIKARVSVGHRFDPAVATVNDMPNPWDPDHALDNFLWEITRSVPEGPGADPSTVPILPSSFEIPFWTEVDIRVGRSLRAGQFLGLGVQTDPAIPSVGSDVHVFGWLRVLLSR